MKKLVWHTEKRKVNDLIPYKENPRQMTKEQVADLKKSIEKFNLVEILAIDVDNKVIAGHQRLRILQLLNRGEEEIDIRLPNRKLTDEEFKEYNLRSNKNLGEWNWDLLANLDEKLLKDVGFLSGELDKILKGIKEDDEIDDLFSEEVISKDGDVYRLGEHRLMCGDAIKIEDVEKLMDGKKANMVFTDPPYGMDLDTDYSGMKGWHKGKKYDLVIGDDKPFDIRWFDWIDCKEQFWWGADYYVETLPNFGKDGSWMIWDKRVDESKDKMFGSGFEMLWSKQKHQRRLIRQMWAGFMGDAEASKRVHPTQKPSKLAIKVISEYGNNGDIVLDLFGGSGSTLIACEQTNRICYMMELDSAYCDVIRKRYARFIGRDDWQKVTPIIK